MYMQIFMFVGISVFETAFQPEKEAEKDEEHGEFVKV